MVVGFADLGEKSPQGWLIKGESSCCDHIQAHTYTGPSTRFSLSCLRLCMADICMAVYALMANICTCIKSEPHVGCDKQLVTVQKTAKK